MPASTPAAVRRQIKSGKTDPIYLIIGEDEDEKARLAADVSGTVEEDLRPFNVERLYGGDASLGAVLDAARTLPMLSPRRIVIVLHAERLLMPKRESERSARDLAEFEAYVKAPELHASIVLVASDLDRRRRIATLLFNQATVVECGGLEDANDAHRWVRKHLAACKVDIEPAALRVLVSRAGADIARVRSDVERVLVYAAGQKTIHVADVEAVIGPAVSQDDWAVTRAIERGAADVALRELALALDAGAVPYMILGQLGWVTRTKLPPARVPAAVEALYRTDLGLKTSAGDARVLLERLVVELCGGSASRRRRESPSG